jgi:uncharacterized membrane protein
MQSKTQFMGHPIHQILIVFQLGLLATAVIVDVIALVRVNSFCFERSYRMIVAGSWAAFYWPSSAL